MHLANSGRVMVRLSTSLPYGQILCDEKSVRFAKVTGMSGPVAKTYASAISLTNSIKKFVGKKRFALEVLPAKKDKPQRRKRK